LSPLLYVVVAEPPIRRWYFPFRTGKYHANLRTIMDEAAQTVNMTSGSKRVTFGTGRGGAGFRHLWPADIQKIQHDK